MNIKSQIWDYVWAAAQNSVWNGVAITTQNSFFITWEDLNLFHVRDVVETDAISEKLSEYNFKNI